MYKLYYINKIYNFVFCVGEGEDEEKSINQSRNLILRYLRNNYNNKDIQSIAFEDEFENHPGLVSFNRSQFFMKFQYLIGI